MLPEIAILFPDARFIDCTRHPGDTFISAIQTEMNEAHSYSYDPQDFALYHHHHRRLMQHWKQALPGRIFDLGYEELVTDPRGVVGELLAFLGLPWQEACLSPGANASTVRTFSRLQVKSAIHAGSVGRWKALCGVAGADLGSVTFGRHHRSSAYPSSTGPRRTPCRHSGYPYHLSRLKQRPLRCDQAQHLIH